MNLILLSATLLALVCGPLLYAAARLRPNLLAFLDGFVLVAISGLVVLEVLPDTLAAGGAWSLGFLVLGALGPSLLEHQLHHARQAHVAALMLAIAGLVLHSVGDGTALAPQVGGEPHIGLALAIAVHSIPVGLVVWWLLYPVFGALLPALAIGAMCAGTVAGYVFAGAVSAWLGAIGWAWLQALVAGSILHVVFGRPHLEETSGHRLSRPPFEGLGNLAALSGLVVLELLHAPGHGGHGHFVQHLQTLALQTAPALLLAWLLGGWLDRRRAARPRVVDTGGARYLLRCLGSGAAQAETVDALQRYRDRVLGGERVSASLAWLGGARQFGLTTLLVSVPLLGWDLSLLRIGGGLLIALVLALLMGVLFPQPPLRAFRFDATPLAPLRPMAVAPAPCSPADQRLSPAPPPTLIERADRGAPWMLAGLLLAAAALPYLQTAPWSALPPALQILLFTTLGLVFSTNAVAATPLAAVLLASKLGSGPALAFMLAGPLVNMAMIGGLQRLHEWRFAAAFTVLALLLALSAATTVATLAIGAASPLATPPDAALDSLRLLSLAAFGVLVTRSILRQGGRGFFGHLIRHDHVHT